MRIITICGFLAVAAILSIGRVVIDAAERVVHAVPDLTRRVVSFIGDLCLDAVRADYGNSARFGRWVVTRFRVLGLLRPEYDDSLETDGQNFERGVRLASHC